MKSYRTYMLKLILLSLLLTTGCALLWYCLGPVLPRRYIKTIQPGMSQKDVTAILGVPSTITDDVYIYEKPFNPGYVQVCFNKNGEVIYVNDESVFGE